MATAPFTFLNYDRCMDMQYPQPIYFIGIALPPELDKTISDLKWQLRDDDKHLLKPLLPHVTLLHPPSLRGIMPEELIPKVREIAARYLPLTISCEEFASFGGSVAYIRCQSQSLYSLQSQLVQLLPPEAQTLHYKRTYVPHITLAQAYEPHALDLNTIENQTQRTIELPVQFTVESVSCFTRILPREYRTAAV